MYKIMLKILWKYRLTIEYVYRRINTHKSLLIETVYRYCSLLGTCHTEL